MSWSARTWIRNTSRVRVVPWAACLCVAGSLGAAERGVEDTALPLRGVAEARSAEEWRERLTPAQYFVLVGAGTERPFSSPLLKERRRGEYVSAASPSWVLFRSEDKFDSGTGWPSFTRPVRPDAVIERIDRSHGMERVEVLCARTGLHLGHVFDDGPPPTGKRYCMNGVALAFVPREPAAGGGGAARGP